ncbi:MAG: hypothetical protein Q4G43_00470 [Mobilicoccus sp.]|nr:hypothetical protein [Mobilicoccus sp.]
MKSVTVRDLLERSDDVLAQVGRGATLLVTRDGEGVAVLGPVSDPALSAAEVVARFRPLPRVGVASLRHDTDTAIDPSL